MQLRIFIVVLLAAFLLPAGTASGKIKEELIYNPGALKPTDSELKVKIGEEAPGFSLPSTTGDVVSLSDYKGRKNVVITFVPAAFTPVCSDQWPGYNLLEQDFEDMDAVLLGITVDNVPTLHAWCKEMGELWFPVLSDFWPHGDTAKKYGVLRSDGVTERAIFVIDKVGVIRYIDVTDINKRPNLRGMLNALRNIAQ